MNRSRLLCAILFLLVTVLNAQDNNKRPELYPSSSLNHDLPPDRSKVKSLIEAIQSSENDTVKVNLLIELASIYPPSYDSTLLLATEAEGLAAGLKFQRGIYRALEMQSGHFGTYGKGDFNQAIAIHKKMLSIAEENRWPKQIHDGYASILNILFYRGDFPGAMNLSTKGLAIAEENSDISKIAYYKNLLAFISLRQGDHDLARSNYTQFLKDAEQIKDSMKIMEAKMGLGEVLLAEKKPVAAIQILEPVMNFYSGWITRHGGGFKTEKAIYSTFALAQAYRDAGQLSTALDLCLRGFSYSDSIVFNEYDLANYYLITGSVYEKIGKIDEAIKVYRTGLSISLQIKHAEDVRDGYAALARVYSALKRFDSAYRYQQLYGWMKDSIVNVQTRSEIQRINALYDIHKKDLEIEDQKQLHEAELKRQALLRNVIMAGVVLALLIAWLLYNRYRLKEKHMLHQQLANQRTELMTNFINTQNVERSRLARDIHDQVGTLLSAAKLKLSDLEETILSNDKEKLQASLSTLDQAANFLRNISHNLAPASLSRLGLVLALEHFFSQLKQVSSLKIDFSVHSFNGRLDETLETNLYPIVLELTNNVIRHANAKNLIIQLIRYPDKVNLTVEDDGVGFNYQGNKDIRTGIGLTNIESRVEIMKGSLDIDSMTGRGTIVMVDVPV